MRRALVTVGVALSAATVCAAKSAAQAAPPASASVSTLAGVYSSKQADRGEEVYKASCLECHVPSDYTGEAFTSKFVGGTAYDMFESIRSAMPQNNPGSLTNQQYADVVAYLFKLNALPTREADLPTDKDSLKAIKVEAKPPTLLQQLMQRTTQGVTSHHGPSHIR